MKLLIRRFATGWLVWAPSVPGENAYGDTAFEAVGRWFMMYMTHPYLREKRWYFDMSSDFAKVDGDGCPITPDCPTVKG